MLSALFGEWKEKNLSFAVVLTLGLRRRDDRDGSPPSYYPFLAPCISQLPLQ